MTVPAGDWDKVYDSTLGTIHEAQGWEVGFGPTVMEDGFLRVWCDDVGSVQVFEQVAQVTTVAARFKVVVPINPPGSDTLGTCAMTLIYDNYTVALLFSKDGLKTSTDFFSFDVVYDQVNFEDGEFYEVYGVLDLGTETVTAYVNGEPVWTEDLAFFDFGFSFGQYSYGASGNFAEVGEQSVSHLDWFVASYDEMIIPVPEGGQFGDTAVSLGASGITVEFDEWALYDSPLSEIAILRHWQSSQGIPSL